METEVASSRPIHISAVDAHDSGASANREIGRACGPAFGACRRRFASIDEPKFQLQRQGYAAAISHPRVLNAIASGPNQRIAICFVEWSGPGAQKIVIDWTPIGDSDAAGRFGDLLLEEPRSFADRTSISGAIDFAAALFDQAPYNSARRAIDVSGDGNNNSGRDIAAARDDAVAKGIVVNGLVILTDGRLSVSPDHTNPPGGLENYYRHNVIGGPGAFVVVAQDFNSFGDAILKKMVTEIADRPHLHQAASSK